uniref:Uncharacterized protein n=1 Tax=Ascaris lumbricoides TaxID=6252 RepID=A0A0M3HLC1_ASCLU
MNNCFFFMKEIEKKKIREFQYLKRNNRFNEIENFNEKFSKAQFTSVLLYNNSNERNALRNYKVCRNVDD